MQVWISTHFGVISERPPTANEEISFIHATITPLHHFCKTISSSFYSLLPPAHSPMITAFSKRPFPNEGLIDVPFGWIRLRWIIRMTSADADCVLTPIEQSRGLTAPPKNTTS